MNEPIDVLHFADLPFAPLSIDEILDRTRHAWESGTNQTFLYQNFHTLHLQVQDPAIARAYEQTTPIVDGLPVIALLRAGGHELERSQRVTAIDLVDPMMALATTEKRRVFVIGQQPSVLHAALSELRLRHQGLEISGHHGFIDLEMAGDEHVIAQANDFGADLVLVGMGSPKTELWCQERRQDIDAPVVWACGALMEYVAGTVATPPRWAGPMGLEWAFRLLDDPKRFFGRYFLEPPLLAARVGKRLAAKR